jgi:hypothetical protein
MLAFYVSMERGGLWSLEGAGCYIVSRYFDMSPLIASALSSRAQCLFLNYGTLLYAWAYSCLPSFIQSRSFVTNKIVFLPRDMSVAGVSSNLGNFIMSSGACCQVVEKYVAFHLYVVEV